MSTGPNVQQAVPFFLVSNMESSLRFYLEGLGFTMKLKWIDEGQLQWCWLEIGEASLMLQVSNRDEGKRGVGVSICFMCRDAIAIYHELKSRGIDVATPFVGNGLWVTSVSDPDGYRLDFESPTDVEEDTVYDVTAPASPPTSSSPA